MQNKNQTWWQRRTNLERRLMQFLLLLGFLNVVALIVALGVMLSGRINERVKREINQSKLFCLSYTCNSTASKLLQEMDLSKAPCDDFYQFACGGFLENTKIPEDDSVVDFFTLNQDVVHEQLRTILEEPIQPNEIRPLVLLKTFYKSCMNATAIESDGLATIIDILKQLGGWPVLEGEKWKEDAFNWKESVYKLRKLGIDANYLLNFNVDVDEKNTTRNLINLYQAELGLHEAYFEDGIEDERVEAYFDFMVDIAVIMGATRENALEQLEKSLDFEMELSELCLTYEELRNLSALYNLMTISEMQQKFPTIPWLEYINNALGVPDISVKETETIDVTVPEYIKGLEDLLEKTPKRVLANYFVWRVVQFSLPYLTEDLRRRKFEFHHVIAGTQKTRPRWNECIYEVSKEMNLALSAMYVRKHSSSNIKSNVLAIVSNVKNAFLKLLKQVDWMDEHTRKRALEKAAAITTHVAYPDELLDDEKLIQYYSKLEVTFENYFKSILAIDLFDTDYYFGLLRQPYNKTNWIEHAFPTEVDAFYAFTENSIRFTAGLLHGVFYNKDFPQYMNYGGLGFLIGHEITHGFDVQGAEFDKDGNLQNWWNNDTKEVFKKKAQCIIDQYDNYTIPEINANLNGINNQEENIADNGGVRAAYLAYTAWSDHNEIEPQLPGLNYTSKQMFWIATAHAWCGKYRDEYLKVTVATDPHPPNSFRILGSFKNLEYFSTDFNCPMGSNMNPEKKCRVW